MGRKAIFVAATGQHVGKTTICLGMIASLKKVFPRLGFMKPVGQQHKKVEEDLLVDKDVILFKEYFHLTDQYADMSPVIFPPGFTRDYLDGRIQKQDLIDKISSSFYNISSKNDFTIVEGTGHIGVGSIVHLNNAFVASLLGLDVILIAQGGLGSAFDELSLNKSLCDQLQVKIRGVILNRVREEKWDMIHTYFTKALSRWDIPLIGCIPYNEFLNTPSMKDFALLFQTALLSGEEFHYRHFPRIRLVATSLETFTEKMFPDQLIVTPATRGDIISALIDHRQTQPDEPEHGLILTGHRPPLPSLLARLKQAQIPTLYTDCSSYDAMCRISSFTAKIHKGDISKVEKAIELVENSIDFSYLV